MRARFFLLILSGLLAGVGFVVRPPLEWRFAVPVVVADTGQAAFQTVFDYQSPIGTAHAPAIDLTEDGFDLIWFDGVRESSNDVRIFRARFREDDSGWQASAPVPVLSRQSVTAAMTPPQTVLTLGNTVEFDRNPGDYLATIVSVGGWAMSSVAAVDMVDDVAAWARKLNLSPLLNRSFLVKSPMVAFEDGIDGLPVYFELGNVFGALARVDHKGRVRAKSRMVGNLDGIQPALVVTDPLNAVALLRNFDDKNDRLLASWTYDGGKNWTTPEALAVPNPNAPVAALRLPGGRILMAFNDDPSRSDRLRLAVSDDGGRAWIKGAVLEEGGGAARYPAMRYLPDGRIVLVYSVGGKTGIRAHVFTQSWATGE